MKTAVSILLLLFLTPLVFGQEVDTVRNEDGSYEVILRQDGRITENKSFSSNHVLRRLSVFGKDSTETITDYYEDGTVEVQSSYKYIAEYDGVDVDEFIPVGDAIRFNENGDTVYYRNYSFDKSMKSWFCGGVMPSYELRIDRNEQGVAISRESFELFIDYNGCELYPIGWQYYNYADGLLNRKEHYRRITKKERKLYGLEGDYTFKDHEFIYRENGQLLKELIYTLNGKTKIYHINRDDAITVIRGTNEDGDETVDFYENGKRRFLVRENYERYNDSYYLALSSEKDFDFEMPNGSLTKVSFQSDSLRYIERKSYDSKAQLHGDQLLYDLDERSKRHSNSEYKHGELTEQRDTVWYENDLRELRLFSKGKYDLYWKYDSKGRLSEYDSSGYKSSYSYGDWRGDSTRIYETRRYFNDKLLSEIINRSDNRGYLMEYHWYDTLRHIDSVKTVSFSYSPLTTYYEDTITTIGTYSLKNGSEQTGKWLEYGTEGLRKLEKFPPYMYTVDTIECLYEKGIPYQLTVHDTVNKLYIQTSELDTIISKSKYFFNSDIVSRRSYHPNGRLFIDFNESIFDIYYPSGFLASNSRKFNAMALDYLNDYLGARRFDYPHSIYGGQILTSNLNLMLPRMDQSVSLTGSRTGILKHLRNTRYAVRDNGLVKYDLIDCKLGRVVKYRLLPLDGGGDYDGYSELAPTDHPRFIKFIPNSNVPEWAGYEIEDDGSTVRTSGNYAIDPSAQKMCVITGFGYESRDSDKWGIKMIDLENGFSVFEEQFKVIGNKFWQGPMITVEFLTDDLLYMDGFKEQNVFSLSKKKFVDSIDLELYQRNAKITYELNDLGERQQVMYLKTGTGILIRKLSDYGLDKVGVNDYQYYPEDGKLFMIADNSETYKDDLLCLNMSSGKMDTLLRDVNDIFFWPKHYQDLEVLKGNQLYNVHRGTTRRFLSERKKILDVRVEDNTLFVQVEGGNHEIPIPGLRSDTTQGELPYDAKWEAAFVLKESRYYLDSMAFVSGHKGKQINLPVDSMSITFWNPKDTSRLKRHVSLVFCDDHYTFVTPDMYYMSSEVENSALYFEKDLYTYSLSQFDLKYNRPDIILERLGYTSKEKIKSYQKAYEKRLQKMGFSEKDIQSDIHLPTASITNENELPHLIDQSKVDLKLRLKDTKYPLDRLNVWVNGVPVYGMDGVELRNADNSQLINRTISVELNEGYNKIEVSVLNQAGAESYKETVTVECSKKAPKPNLYFVGIGVKDYADESMNLKYSDKDIADVAEMYAKNSNYGKVFIDTFLNTSVTKAILPKIRKRLASTTVHDQVILMYSGHGVLDRELDYYLTTHDMDFSDPKENGLLYDEVDGLLDGIPARQKLILIDACNSGEVDKDDTYIDTTTVAGVSEMEFSKAGLNAVLATTSDSYEVMKEIFTDLRRGTGATVISSSSGLYYSFEDENYQNGIYTYALKLGLQGEADTNSDQQVTVSELTNYLYQKVSDLTNGRQQPNTRQENLEFDFRVY